jgi:hypothetical protein
VANWNPDLVVFDPFVLHFYPTFRCCGCRAVSLSTKPLLTYDPLAKGYVVWKYNPMNLSVVPREPIRLMMLGRNRGKASEETKPVIREPNAL